MSGRLLTHSFYLAISRRQRGWKELRARLTEKQPALDAGEIAVQVSLTLPEALFLKPMLRAAIKVPADSVTPTTVDASVAENLVEVIRQHTGLEVTLQVDPA